MTNYNYILPRGGWEYLNNLQQAGDELPSIHDLFADDDDEALPPTKTGRGLLDDEDRRLNEATDAINGYLTHYGMQPVGNGESWAEVMERIHTLLRHLEDVLPAPAPAKKHHPLYPEHDT